MPTQSKGRKGAQSPGRSCATSDKVRPDELDDIVPAVKVSMSTPNRPCTLMDLGRAESSWVVFTVCNALRAACAGPSPRAIPRGVSPENNGLRPAGAARSLHRDPSQGRARQQRAAFGLRRPQPSALLLAGPRPTTSGWY
jgi:hypothetical protein